MKQLWFDYNQKFLQLSSREQILLLLSGLAVIFFFMSFVFIDQQQANMIKFDKQIQTNRSDNSNLDIIINDYELALARDTDVETQQNIAQLNVQLTNIDNKLSLLNSNLISPNQMRTALIKLLALEPGVSLLSFELMEAEPLLRSDPTLIPNIVGNQADNKASGLNFYKHIMKIKLSGQYFQLRNYLAQVEQLSWTFFWQDFHLQVKDYPLNEVDITIYSLGAEKEFVGV
jgi:MSHA biogenesis protein MshJ